MSASSSLAESRGGGADVPEPGTTTTVPGGTVPGGTVPGGTVPGGTVVVPEGGAWVMTVEPGAGVTTVAAGAGGGVFDSGRLLPQPPRAAAPQSANVTSENRAVIGCTLYHSDTSSTRCRRDCSATWDSACPAAPRF